MVKLTKDQLKKMIRRHLKEGTEHPDEGWEYTQAWILAVKGARPWIQSISRNGSTQSIDLTDFDPEFIVELGKLCRDYHLKHETAPKLKHKKPPTETTVTTATEEEPLK